MTSVKVYETATIDKKFKDIDTKISNISGGCNFCVVCTNHYAEGKIPLSASLTEHYVDINETFDYS